MNIALQFFPEPRKASSFGIKPSQNRNNSMLPKNRLRQQIKSAVKIQHPWRMAPALPEWYRGQPFNWLIKKISFGKNVVSAVVKSVWVRLDEIHWQLVTPNNSAIRIQDYRDGPCLKYFLYTKRWTQCSLESTNHPWLEIIQMHIKCDAFEIEEQWTRMIIQQHRCS